MVLLKLIKLPRSPLKSLQNKTLGYGRTGIIEEGDILFGCHSLIKCVRLEYDREWLQRGDGFWYTINPTTNLQKITKVCKTVT